LNFENFVLLYIYGVKIMKNKIRRLFNNIIMRLALFTAFVLLPVSVYAGGVPPGLSIIQSAGCSGCHMINGKGGSMGPDLSAIGSALSLKGIKGALGLMVSNGYASLTPAQIYPVAAYLKTLKAKTPTVINTASAADILKSAGCLGCHADTKGGSGIAPNLYDIGGILGLKGIETAVDDMNMEIIAKTLDTQEVNSVTAYLESLKLPPVKVKKPPKKAAAGKKKKLSGADLMNSAGCMGCHTTTGTGITIGPDLSTVGSTLNSYGIDVGVYYMNNYMIASPLPRRDISVVEAYLSQKLNKKPPAYESVKTPAALVEKTCLLCHTMNGVYGTAGGDNHGPAFNFSIFEGRGNMAWWWGAINMNKKFFASQGLTSAQLDDILNYSSFRYAEKRGMR
jgi:mono/diheme cytochrome c family protein